MPKGGRAPQGGLQGGPPQQPEGETEEGGLRQATVAAVPLPLLPVLLLLLLPLPP
jgi:hypothetical protein